MDIYSYDTYQRSDNSGKQWIMRQVFQQFKSQQETIERLERDVQELKQRKQPRVIGHRHGVKDQFDRAQNGEKPKIIS